MFLILLGGFMIKRERFLRQIRPFYDSEMIKVITAFDAVANPR